MNLGKSPLLFVLDVGHGNCAVLCTKNETVVIDTGERAALQEFLSEQGIKQIDHLFLSHADKDHIGGLVGLISSRAVKLGHVYLNTDSDKDTELWRDLVYELDDADTKKQVKLKTSLTSDDSLALEDGRVLVEILGPSKAWSALGPGAKDKNGKTISSNAISAVVRIGIDGRPIALLPGDVDELGIGDLEEHKKSLAASILVFPHHGGNSGASGAIAIASKLWQLVHPKLVILSVARGRDKHPQPELIKVIRSEWKGCRIACTQLTTRCSDKVAINPPAHLAKVFSAGREMGSCCGGTVVIDLESVVTDPDGAAHQEFIQKNAATALCRT